MHLSAAGDRLRLADNCSAYIGVCVWVTVVAMVDKGGVCECEQNPGGYWWILVATGGHWRISVDTGGYWWNKHREIPKNQLHSIHQSL